MTQRLPKKPPVRRVKKTTFRTAEEQAQLERLVRTGIPRSDRCTYFYGAEGRPHDCGKPVIADWYQPRIIDGKVRYVLALCACERHDANAAISNLRVNPEERWRRVEIL